MEDDDESDYDYLDDKLDFQLVEEDPTPSFTPSHASYSRARLYTIPEKKSIEPINLEEIMSNPCVERIYSIEMDENVRREIACTLGRDLELSYQYIKKEIIINHINKHAELSPFFNPYAEIKHSKTEYVWVYTDYKAAGDKYFFCAEPIREYEMKSLILTLTEKNMEILEELGNNLLEVEESKKKEQLKTDLKCVYGVFDTEYGRQKNIILSSVETDELCGGYVYFESDESGIKTSELEFSSCFEKQVHPYILATKETQTKAYIANNKSIQKDDMFFEEIDERMNRKVICSFRKYSDFIHKSVSEYRNVSVYEGILDQYRLHEKSINKQHKSLTLLKPLQLTENWLFIQQTFKVIPNYMKVEHVSCIAWHPRYIDYVAIAYRGHIGLGKDYFPDTSTMQEGYFEKIPQADYLIMIWKVTNELCPTRIITSEFEIVCLKFNENYPSLLAGADNLGQIILWDLNTVFLPERFVGKKILTYFGDQHVPWKYIPPIITFDTFRIDDINSHEDPISDIQWFPRNCKVRKDEELYEKIQSEKFVTGSEDGSVKIWIFQGSDSIPEKVHKQCDHLSDRYCQQIDELLESNKYFIKGVEYVLERVEDEKVPVTAVSCSTYHTSMKTYLPKTSSFSYSSLRDGVNRQENISCNIITAFCNGKLRMIHAEYTKERTNQGPIEGKDTIKNLISDFKRKAYQFRHEGPIVCLRRCPYATDVALSVSTSSFCVWKEGTTKVRPVFWKKNNTDKEYTNGDWSLHKTAGIVLLTSYGIVEFWDLIEQDNSPFMTLRVRTNTVGYDVLPMTFTLKEDQLIFMEQDVLYFARIPHTLKKSSIPEGDLLQNMGNHEVFRRRKYYIWKLIYKEINKEEIANKVRKFKDILNAERLKKLSMEFSRAKFEECIKLKTPIKKKILMDDGLPQCNLTLNAVPKEEMEMKVSKELQAKRAIEIEEKPSTSSNYPPKVTARLEDLTKEMHAALDSYIIDESQQGLGQSEKYFSSCTLKDKVSPFSNLFKEMESEYDSIDMKDAEMNTEEKIDNNEIGESSKDEGSNSNDIEPYNAFAYEFIDFYSWMRFLDLYNLFPVSVLHDQQVNLMPKGNATYFALDCEEKFLTGLSKNTLKNLDGSK